MLRHRTEHGGAPTPPAWLIIIAISLLPLAIELAADRARLLPLPALLERLERRLELLTGGARDLPERHRSLRATLDWSWDALDRPEQQLPVMELDRLEDYGSRFSELYGDGVCMVLAHTSTGQHYPNVFDDQNKVYAIPAGTSYQLLYQSPAPDAYRLKEYPLDKSQLDWTTFGQP